MVFFARKMKDNQSLFTLCKEITQKGINISTFCMGVRGMLSRVFCVNHGSAYTYASIGEKTAPGQVSISEFVQLYKKGEESLQKKIEDKYKRK